MAKRRTIYRDSKTGRFVKKSTWTRSLSHGGDRYKRERTISRKHKKPDRLPVRPTPEAEPPAVFEWIVSFSYNRSRRSFDVIVTAATRADALSTAKEFLRADIDGSRIARSGFKNWSAAIARGNVTEIEAGNAEYRSKSRAKRKKRPD